MVATPPWLRSTFPVQGRGLHSKWQRALSINFAIFDDENDHSLQRKPFFVHSRPLALHSLEHEEVCARGKCANFYIEGNDANSDGDGHGVNGVYKETGDTVFGNNALNGAHADDGNGKLDAHADDGNGKLAVKGNFLHAGAHYKLEVNGGNGSLEEKNYKYRNPFSIDALSCDYAGTSNANYNKVAIGNTPIFDQPSANEEHVHSRKEGQGPLDLDRLVIASSGDMRQLDMALDALLHMHGPQPRQTYLALLQACNMFKSLSQAKQVHAHITMHAATLLTSFLGDYLVMTLAKCGAVDDAYGLYVTLPRHTIYSCTAILSAYVECGEAYEALKVYQSMQDEGMEPDNYTFVSLFKACGSIQDLELGKFLHIYACKKGFTSVPHVNNILINMYGKCGAINEAGKLFSGQSKSNIVAWGTMLSAYIEHGQPRRVLQLYVQMQKEGLIRDQFAIVFALQACGMIADKKQGLIMEDNLSLTSHVKIVLALHAEALRKGYVRDVFVGTALLTAYAKCGTISEAENMFSMLTERNLVTWNAMLSAYMDQGQDEKALHLFMELQKGVINPGQLTFVLAFQACGNAAEKESTVSAVGNLSKAICLEILQALHADFCNAQKSLNTVVATALLSSYAKCGAVVEAENVFAALSHRDVVSWNAMLTVYVEQGKGERALCLYNRMQEEHATLNDVTMINALLACSETGSLNVCTHVHYNIVSANYDSNLQVVATLIYTYGNCAKMTDARVSFDEIPKPDAASWNAYIAGYAGGGSYAMAFSMFENAKLAGLIVCEIAFTSVLLACTHSGLIAAGLELFESMRIDFGIIPDSQHYSILVDLLARVGDFKRLEDMLGRVDMQGNLNTWLFILGACHTHGNIDLAKRAFNHASSLQPKQATAYVLMSNIYANAELQG